MKITAYLLILVIMALLILFDFRNIAVSTGFFHLNNSYTTVILPMVITVAFACGLIAGVLYSLIAAIDAKKTSFSQSRRVEKMSVDKDSAEMKIQTLEAKIQTLEVALDKALSDR